MSDAKTTGTLKYGLKVGEQMHKEFVLRQVTTGDYMAAEASGADQSQRITFQVELIAQQLVRIGTFEGPFTSSMLARLPVPDVDTLMKAREALELSGEGWQHG